MNYNEAYSKIIDAYFKDQIKPMSSAFCFCGTLAPDSGWNGMDINICPHKYPYSYDEYKKMESALFESGRKPFNTMRTPLKNYPEYEETLFAGMSAALDVLKQIHIERGEVIDQPQPFTKRELKTV